MSQHRYSTMHEKRPVCVLVGWDKPLQGFFLVIEYEDSMDDEYLYSNLEDLSLVAFCGLPPTFDHFSKKLQEFGIDLPGVMLQELEMDKRSNTGNRTVVYDMSGEVKSDSARIMA